jgi:hypothetical protein
MANTDYRINQPLPDPLKQEISAQPGLIAVESNSMSSLYTFDHSPQQATDFKKWLNRKLGLYDDALSKYTNFTGMATAYTTDYPVTLTNIGTTFKNVYNRSDGMSFGIDTDIYEEVRLVVHWTMGGSDTGVHSLRVVDKAAPSTVLASFSTLVSGSNQGAIVPIPVTLLGTQKLYLVQVKSTVATDDPVFEGARVYLR